MNKAQETLKRIEDWQNEGNGLSVPTYYRNDKKLSWFRSDGTVDFANSRMEVANAVDLSVWILSQALESGDTINLPFPVNIVVEGGDEPDGDGGPGRAPEEPNKQPVASNVLICKVAEICYEADRTATTKSSSGWASQHTNDSTRRMWENIVLRIVSGEQTGSPLTRAIVASQIGGA